MGIKDNKIQRNRGMTYVELIVVLSIFSVLSSVAIFNYGAFQARVDIKNLASDIALKIVEAQKAALSGILPQAGAPSSTWKPSYGIYFDTTTPETAKQFIYFVDSNSDKNYTLIPNEALDTVSITKNNSISEIKVVYQDNSISTPNNLNITFSRPNSGAFLYSSGVQLLNVSYVQITVLSPKGATSLIKLYPPGRVEVK